MLEMSGLDTYKSIEHFARNPHAPENILSLAMLRRKTETRATWEANAVLGPENLEEKTDIFLGALAKETKHTNAEPDILDGIMDKPLEDQLDMYAKLCASAGYSIDPQALLDKTGVTDAGIKS